MEKKLGFQRFFLIFNQEDTGYGTGQQPSGYVRIEVRDGQGKLHASVSNLKEDETFGYKLYLLRDKDGVITPVDTGTLKLVRGRGEKDWSFNPLDVGGSGGRIDDFEIAAVLVDAKDRRDKTVICPLAAYKKGKKPWKEKLGRLLNPPERMDEDIRRLKEEMLEKGDVISKYTGGLQSKYEGHKKLLEPLHEEKPAEIGKGNILEPGKEPDEQVIRETAQKEGAGENEQPGVQSIAKEQRAVQGCAGMESVMCKLAQDGGYNPCASCLMNTGATRPAHEGSYKTNITCFVESMEKQFEKCDPFKSNRRDYQWWKIGSPVHLNNILYQCKIRTPLLLNPAVMLSHFKYKHLIFGIYTDTMRRREILVCGIPALLEMDERPFGELCRWVQVENVRPRRGAFGYWLVYIDPATGKFLNLS